MEQSLRQNLVQSLGKSLRQGSGQRWGQSKGQSLGQCSRHSSGQSTGKDRDKIWDFWTFFVLVYMSWNVYLVLRLLFLIWLYHRPREGEKLGSN